MKHASLIAVAALVTACSTDVDGLFSNDGADGNGGASSTSGSASKGASTSGQTSGSVAQSSSVQQSSAASTAQQTSATTVAQSSSATGVLSPTVWCNSTECAPGEVCCYFIPEEGQDFCSSQGSCPADDGWIEITCNGPDDCPGETCCGTIQNNSWVDVSCKSSCNGGNDLELCTGDPGVCDGGMCQQSMLLGQGYMYCAN